LDNPGVQHAIVGVVDENGGNQFSAGSSCHNFPHADGGQIAITLIGENGFAG
jgi:hypothetical protein